MTAPQQNLSDERLAWLAVRADLKEESKNGAGLNFFLRVLRIITLGRVYGVRGVAGNVRLEDEIMDKKMKTYAIAVDELSRRLTKEDRLVLRSTGKLPAWFLPSVKVEAHNIKLGSW